MRPLSVLLASSIVAAGCSGPSPEEAQFEAAKSSAAYELSARAVVGGDILEFWKEATGNAFGRFLIAAREPSGRFIGFGTGEFVCSSRPYYQDDRYAALAASTGLGKERDVFFVYDSLRKRFTTHAVGDHVHEGLVIVGDELFFSSCKTPEPVCRVDLLTGEQALFGHPAPQGAQFYVQGDTVLIIGADKKTYAIEGRSLVPRAEDLSARQPTAVSFDAIRVGSDYDEPTKQEAESQGTPTP